MLPPRAPATIRRDWGRHELVFVDGHYVPARRQRPARGNPPTVVTMRDAVTADPAQSSASDAMPQRSARLLGVNEASSDGALWWPDAITKRVNRFI